MVPPGRFLEKNAVTCLWSDIGDRKAIEKTSQALRDGAADLRKQLSADLGDPDFLSAVFDMEPTKGATLKEKSKAVKVRLTISNSREKDSLSSRGLTHPVPFVRYSAKTCEERPPAHKVEPRWNSCFEEKVPEQAKILGDSQVAQA